MSLDVPPTMIEAAQRGELDDAAFVAVVRDSLPYAWQVISQVVGDLMMNTRSEFADHAVPPPDEAARGQLLRALASDAIRGALQRHFGVQLAFQNCHRVAAFRPEAVSGDTYRRFVSARSQVLNQTPEFRDC
ncbi:MAG: SCO5389 family protein [Pseudonocardiaceae bacterium]